MESITSISPLLAILVSAGGALLIIACKNRPNLRELCSVAAGVVTFSGKRFGYGEMIEISHGSGLVTRYGHNDTNLVQIGDTVHKGEAIALMGSSGRSTGPHVHLEVLKHGKKVNPLKYVR